MDSDMMEYMKVCPEMHAIVLHIGHLIILLHTLAIRKQNKIVYVTSLHIFLTRQTCFD